MIRKAVITAAFLALASPSLAQTNLVIGTGGTGGTYYPVGVGMARLVSEIAPSLQVDAVTSGGSTENIQLIARGEIDIGITNGVVATLAAKGEDVFAGDARTSLRSLFALWGNTEHHVALKDSTTTGTVDDIASLSGKYNIGARQSGARTAANLMLSALGHDPEAIDMEFLAAYSEAASALQDRRIAAANMGAGIPVAAVTELYASMGADRVTILSFTDEQIAKIDAAHPGLYYAVEIPAGTYPGQAEAIPTAEYANLVIADASTDEAVIYDFVKAIFDNIERVHSIHPAAQVVSLEAALAGLPVPLHPGAVRYFEEVGVAVPDRLKP